MDYKYIEQLLERYWQCETSLEEEEILRAFFSQPDVPAELRQYGSLFAYAHDERQAESPLGSDFDERVMSMVEEMTPVKARHISIASRLKPLLKAAAVVAVVVSVGSLMQLPFSGESIIGGKKYTAADGETMGAEVAREEVMDAFGLTASDAYTLPQRDTAIVGMAIINVDTLVTK